MPKLFSVLAIKNFVSMPVMPFIMMFMLSLSTVSVANDHAAEITIKRALETAQTHTPGKVVAHEKTDEQVTAAGTVEGSGRLQPVYRIKILSQQGVMKTVRVHRHTGLVIE